jgi:hypothetical protein
MPAKTVAISKRPIEQYDYDHIFTREKKIITEELIREHKRAEKLAKGILAHKKVFDEIKTISEKTGATGETGGVGKLRLGKDVTDIMGKINGLNIGKLDEFLVPNQIQSSDDDSSEANTEEKKSNVHEKKTFKLDPNTRTFSGASGDGRLSQWIFIINEAFTAINLTSDKMKLALITNYVKGMALNTLMRYKTEDNPTWDGFVKLLKEQYEDSNLDYKLRTQFFHLRMENSFPKYLAKFQELLNQLPSLTYDNQTVLDKFTDGLSKEMAFHVKREKCESLNHAIEICNDLNCLSLNDDDRNEKINFTKTNFKSNKMQKSFKKTRG